MSDTDDLEQPEEGNGGFPTERSEETLYQELRETNDEVDEFISMGYEYEDATSQVKAMANELRKLLSTKSSPETIQKALGTIKSFGTDYEFSTRLYDFLDYIDKKWPPGLFIPLLERKEADTVVAASQIVVETYSRLEVKEVDAAVRVKAVNSLLDLLKTANPERKRKILSVFNKTALLNLGSSELVSKATAAVVLGTVERFMKPNANVTLASNQLLVQTHIFFDNPERVFYGGIEGFITAVETAADGRFYPGRISELVAQGVASISTEEEGSVGESALHQLLQFINTTIDEEGFRADLGSAEGVRRRKQLLLANASLIPSLRQLTHLPEWSNVHDIAAEILAELAQDDRARVYADDAGETAHIMKLLEMEFGTNGGRARYVVEYLRDPSCLAAAMQTDPTLVPTFRRLLHWGLEEASTAVPLQVFKFFDMMAETPENAALAWDDGVGKDLLVWSLENGNDVRVAACVALVKFLNDDPSRVTALVVLEPVPQLKHIVVAFDGPGRKNKPPFATLFRALSPAEIVVTRKQVTAACEVLLTQAGTPAKNITLLILSWLDKNVLDEAVDAELKEAISAAVVASAETLPPPPPTDQGAAEQYMRLLAAELTGPARLGRLMLLALATRSSPVATLLGTLSTDPTAEPGLDVAATVINPWSSPPPSSKATAAYRASFAKDLVFEEIAGGGDPQKNAVTEDAGEDKEDLEEDEAAEEGEESEPPEEVFTEEEIQLSCMVGSEFHMRRQALTVEHAFTLLESSDQEVHPIALELLHLRLYSIFNSNERKEAVFARMKGDRLLDRLLEHAKLDPGCQDVLINTLYDLIGRNLSAFRDVCSDGGTSWVAWLLHVLERPIPIEGAERASDLRSKKNAMSLLVGLDSEDNTALLRAAFRRELIFVDRARWQARTTALLEKELKNPKENTEEEYLRNLLSTLVEQWGMKGEKAEREKERPHADEAGGTAGCCAVV